MTVNTVYFEGRMGCFSLLQFSNLSPPLSCSPLLSRSSPLSLSFSLLSFPFSPFSRFHSPSPFSHPSYLPSFFFLPFSLSFPLFQPFLSPILLLSPPLLHLPCRPLPGAPPPKIGKNKIFWRKIVIFHTKYPKKISRLPPLGAICLSAHPPT